MKQFRKYWAIFQTTLVNNLAYPAELAWRSLAIVLFMFIFAALWSTAYGRTDIALGTDLSLRQVMWYFLLAEVIELSKPRLAQAISAAVKDGSVAYLLNKPFNFLLYQLATGMADSLARGLLNALLGSALVWLLAGPPLAADGTAVGGMTLPDGTSLAIPAVIMAWLIHFCFNAMIGLLAFVVEEVTPFEWIYQKLVQVLGGLFIPLDFFPPTLRAVAQVLPFAYMLYGPARLFVQPDLNQFGQLIAIQAIWLAVLAGLLAVVYNLGARRLAINGG